MASSHRDVEASHVLWVPRKVGTTAMPSETQFAGANDNGDGGGPVKLTLPDLRWNVAILNGLAAIFTAALVGMFLWMVDRIDDSLRS